MSTDMSYALDNQHPKAADLHAALAELYDKDTIDRLIGLSGGHNWAGATCLEVGAGAGSVASRLADAVGDDGRVVATDLKVDHIPAHPRLRVYANDLRVDPLPPGPYQLIHARRVLEHLPEREAILDRLVTALGPGGVILIEDGAAPQRPEEMVITAPSPAAASLYIRYQQTISAAVWDVSGRDSRWAEQIHSALLARGLSNVETRIHGGYWTGGQAGCRLMAAALHHVRPRLIEAGMSAADLDTVLGLLQDPRLVVRGHLLYATSARRTP